MNGQNKQPPQSITLFLGDRGQGKSTALFGLFFELLDSGLDPEQIMFIPGKRPEQVRKIKSYVLTELKTPCANLQIRSLGSLIRETLETFYPFHYQAKPLFIGMTESLVLMRLFHQETGKRFFQGAQISRQFYQKLWGRYHQRHCQAFAWEEMEYRSQLLESSPLAAAANQFLAAYENWITQNHILDTGGQQRSFANLLAQKSIQAKFSRVSHWLIDDIETYSFYEQSLLENFFQGKNVYLTGNPQGNIFRHLGAYFSYLDKIKAHPETQIIPLEHPQPYQGLAKKVWQILHESQPPEGIHSLTAPIDLRPNPTEMLDAMVQKIKTLIAQGANPQEILMITWLLNEQWVLQLETRLKKLGYGLKVTRGSQVIQRNPLINTLLGLLRLIYWQQLKDDQRIPKLTGYEMSQILFFCAEMDPFEIATLRAELKNNLKAWGKFLKSHMDQPKIAELQTQIQNLRESLSSQSPPNFYTLVLAIWENLLLPSPHFMQNFETNSITSFFHSLRTFTELHERLSPLDLSREFLFHLLNEEIYESSEPENEIAQAPYVQLTTLHRLCESGKETDYQLWFDLKSPFWQRSDYHAIDNRLLISREWPESQTWSFEAEEIYMDQKLATMFYKGLQYCQKQAYFYACQFNGLGQRQRFERLCMALENPLNPLPA